MELLNSLNHGAHVEELMEHQNAQGLNDVALRHADRKMEDIPVGIMMVDMVDIMMVYRAQPCMCSPFRLEFQSLDDQVSEEVQISSVR